MIAQWGKCGSEIWISIITHKSGTNRGLSRKRGWLTDSSRMIPAVPQIVTFTPGLLDIYTNITFSLHHTFDAYNRLLYLLSKIQTGKWQLSPTLISEGDCLFVSLNVMCVCVWAHAYLYVLLALQSYSLMQCAKQVYWMRFSLLCPVNTEILSSMKQLMNHSAVPCVDGK